MSPVGRGLLAGLLGGALASGCAQLRVAARYSGPTASAPEVVTYYTAPEVPPPLVGLLEETPTGRLWRAQWSSLPSLPRPNAPPLRAEFYEVPGSAPRPVIIVTPILGGRYDVERIFCRAFVARGLHCVLIHRPKIRFDLTEDLGQIERYLRLTVTNTRIVLDWIAAQPSVDPARIGGFGISHGAMVHALVAAVDPRLRVNVLAMAAGNLPELICATRERPIVKYREQLLARDHQTLEEFQHALTRIIQSDPYSLAPSLDARRTLMYVTLCDRTVGSGRELALWRRAGRPHVVFVPLGHYSAVVVFPYVLTQALTFFERQFELPLDGRGVSRWLPRARASWSGGPRRP